MYLQYFGLNEAPFSLTPDTAFFFAHRGAQNALNTLLVAVRSGEGFVKIVAEVGCGKTLLCRRLLAALAEDTTTAYIPNPSLDAHAMLLAVCEELEIEVPANATAHHIVKELKNCLADHAHRGRRVVLIIDEAQCIPDETVESLRLLSNLETEKHKLLQIVLFGQPELDTKLDQPHLRQLMQRIGFTDYIEPLCEEDVGLYVNYRMQVAGAGRPVFTAASLAELAARSGGIPRVINVVANKALMLAYGEGVAEISRRHIELAADDTAAASPEWWPRAWLKKLLAVVGTS